MQKKVAVPGKSPLQLLLREVDGLKRELKEQRLRLTELEKALAGLNGNAAGNNHAAAQPAAAAENDARITPELMSILAAAVTVYLGKKVKIHQARLVNPEVVSPWAQQGRVFVQASHDLTRF